MERRKLLEQNIKEVKNRIMLSEQTLIKVCVCVCVCVCVGVGVCVTNIPIPPPYIISLQCHSKKKTSLTSS